MNKTCSKEKKRPAYKPKPKKEEFSMPKEPEILFLEGIPYIMQGWPGYETAYALDDKGRIDYALTGWLRKKLENLSEKANQTENI